MSHRPSLNVIIVNYRTVDLTLRCIASIVEQKICDPEDIIVVDNLSPDDSAERLKRELPPSIKLVLSPTNEGFGSGVNIGATNATADFLLVLNPDTYFEFDSVSRVLDYMAENQDVGLVGLDLINPDGSRQFSARRFYSALDVVARRVAQLKPLLQKHLDRHLMLDAWPREEPFDAEWVMGTGFLIPRALYKKLNGMDTRYFLYMEDVDLCARVWCYGYKVKCFPGAELVHDHQRSSASGPMTFAGRAHLKSMMLFRKRFVLPLLKPPGVPRIIKSCTGVPGLPRANAQALAESLANSRREASSTPIGQQGS
ncbi:glycosyltransferase family 2 protein [Rhizobium sp. Leaf371]|uniref:glycosyltransferase family 2 protein n=1 Tax=Rhizobium sp. Leaf371 TaxID=1736355 RepID=UPI0009EA9F07|nr:glycosyltransferase family 2 protein [Rhizobium sp. Leaf371]